MNKKRADMPEETKNRDRTYHAANRGQRNEDARDRYRANFKRTMWRNAQKRARQGGYPCTITIDDIVIPEFCPLLGLRIVTGSGLSAASPSLDKITPSLGYVPGNVWVISWRANMLKNDATLQELELLVANLKNKCTSTGAPQGAGQQALTIPWAIELPATKLESMPWQ